MNLRQIRYFCEVVEAGSGSAAAKRLFVAPTAVSTQLGLLEEELGGELFDRSTRPMQLTSLGQFFFPRAKELLQQSGRLEEEAKAVASGGGGWLGIGFIRSTLFSVLPKVIKAFRESHPDVHLDLVEKLSEYQDEALHKHRIDVGISRFIGEYEHHPDLEYQLLLDDPFVAALPVDHQLANADSISIECFNSVPFIQYPKDSRSPFGHKLHTYMKERGVNSVVHHEAIEIHTALALVGAGLGGTFVGQTMVDNNRRDVAFIPLNDMELSSSLVAVFRKGDQSKQLKSFINVLHESLSNEHS